jgi:hypothetical protein
VGWATAGALVGAAGAAVGAGAQPNNAVTAITLTIKICIILLIFILTPFVDLR